MNRVVAGLTLRCLLGRRRAVVLALLPGLLLTMVTLVRCLSGTDETLAVNLLSGLVVGTVIPLLALIAGTGAIGPEIDDGSVVYLLAKPVSRYAIVTTKFVVAAGITLVFGTLPTLVAGYLLTGRLSGVTPAFAVGTAAAGITYCALFLLLGVLSRHAVILGLLYTVIWESLIGTFAPGAQTLSVQQWALSITERLLGTRATDLGVEAAVDASTGIPLLLAVTLLATWYAGRRLRSLRLTGEE